MIGGWFAAAAVVFSFSSGIIHTYYLSALAPATAALVGAGVVALWRDARAGGPRIGLPVAALALSGWLEVALLRRSGYDSWLQAVVVIGVAAAVVALVALAAGVTLGVDASACRDGRVGARCRCAVRRADGVVVDGLQERGQRRLPGRRPELPERPALAAVGGGGARPAGRGQFGGRGNFGRPAVGTGRVRAAGASLLRAAAPPRRDTPSAAGGATTLGAITRRAEVRRVTRRDTHGSG